MPASLRRFEVPCTPPAWARGGHAQTLLGHSLPSPGAVQERVPGARRREVALDDGDRLALYATDGTSGVRVHLFHGLSGDVDADYLRRSAACLRARGHDVWSVNHRGCGAGRGLAAGTYHSGSSADLRAVLAASRAEAPDRVHLVVGFSLSGNAALLLAAQGLEPLPDGLVAVNPPVDLARASADIHAGLNRLYELRFVWRLKRALREREADGLLRERIAVPALASLRELDDLVTAPLGGFADSGDYYARCSSLPRLGEVGVPAVIVTAGDDPFVDATVYEGARLPSSLLLHVEPTGGHVGYLARDGLGYAHWLDGALSHYVDELALLQRG